MAVLGIVGIAVYLGVLTNEDEGSKFEVRYLGELRVSRGDSWLPDLGLQHSPAFIAKAAKYERMLQAVYDNSFLKGSLRKAKVVRFLKNPVDNHGLGMHFRLSLDRRKMPSHVDKIELAVQDVLLQELMSLEPVAFKNVAVDIDSLHLNREMEVGRAVAPLPQPQEEHVQVIKVEGTQQAPGGAIMIRKPPASNVRRQEEELLPQEEEPLSSTVANFIYQFGPWRPINPFNIYSTSPTTASTTTPTLPSLLTRDYTHSLLNPTLRPSQQFALPSKSEKITDVNSVSTSTTRHMTTTASTTTAAALPSTATTTISEMSAAPLPTTTAHSHFINRVGVVADSESVVDNRMTTTKRNPSGEDLHALLTDLLFFTTTRPQAATAVTEPQLPNLVTTSSESTFDNSQRQPEGADSDSSGSGDQLVTFQSIMDQNRRRPVYSTSHSSSVSSTATTVSVHTPGVPKVTSYTGIKEPLPPRPPPFLRFPQDRFRNPGSSSSATTSSAGTTPFNIWNLLTTKKPLIINTEVVTSTSTDINYGSTDQYSSPMPPTKQQTTHHYTPVYSPSSSSSLSPVYRPNPETYQQDSKSDTIYQYSPIYQPSSEPSPLRDFTEDQNYVTVPVISGNNVQYMLVNKTRSNYPNVVIVNLQTKPEAETTTPMTPARGDSRRLNTKFLEDAFKAVLQSSNYRGVDGALHAEDSHLAQNFSNRRGKPIQLGVPDSPAPLVDSETHKSISLWSVLRNLSQIYLSDPAIIQQLQYFEKAALEALNQQRMTAEPPLNISAPTETATSSLFMTPFFQHLRGSTVNEDIYTDPSQNKSKSATTHPASNYTYIPVHKEATEQHLSHLSKIDTALRSNPVSVALDELTPQLHETTEPQPSYQPFHPTASSPYTTLFMTSVGGKTSSNPQIISVSSRSPAVSSTGSSTTNSPIHTFVLKDGQSMEELLQEIFETISLEQENETIPSTEVPPSDAETTTPESETTYQTTHSAESRDNILESINQIISKHLYEMTSAPELPIEQTTMASKTTQEHHVDVTTTASMTTQETTTPAIEQINKSFSSQEATKLATILESSKILTTVETTKPFTTHNYNLELFPVMTRPMSPVRTTATPKQYEILDDGDNEIKTTVVGNGMGQTAEDRTETSVDVSYSVHSGTTEYIFMNQTLPACSNPSQFRCRSGECITEFSRCNLMQDCRDNSDEVNCTCSDFLRSRFLNRKICDGIVDCWDHSDESNCDWCKPGQFICLGSSKCIEQSQVCDGTIDCDGGDDEKTCVTIAPDLPTGNLLSYHDEGYLMVRKKGVWGKLCVENFERVTSQASTSWTVSDLGQAVCKTLTFSDFTQVERQEDPSPVTRAVPQPIHSYTANSAQTNGTTPTYFEIHISNTLTLPSRTRTFSSEGGSATDLGLSLDFKKTSCPKRDVVRVACSNLQCGRRPRAVSHRARIVGGSNSGPGSWPWHAALYKEGEYQCGATLINHRWLVSAGHCFYSATNNYWVARLGALRRGTKFPSPYEQLRHITHIFIHPEYEDTGFVNDISLLRVDEPVRFTDYVRPICLPPLGSSVHHGRLCTLVGWGQLFEVGKIFPDTLQEVQVPLISTSECRKRTVFIPLYRITEDMFCAGYDRGGRDACLGDSGGPLMCQEPDGGWQLIGVTSNGYGCARQHRPGVYTKVVKYLDWMNQVMELTKSELVVPMSARCEGHRCPLGQCLPRGSVCNGSVECSDGSDEVDCG
ncbi:uncharacterized protein [Panulirus ornatus]